MMTPLQRARRRLLGRCDPFRTGLGFVPGAPVPATSRAALLARQRAEEGAHFKERVLEFPAFTTISPGAPSSTVRTAVPSNGGRFVRLVAMRGVIQSTNTPPVTGLEPAGVLLRLVLNGTDDLIRSELGGSNSASFDMLFSHTNGVYIIPAQLDATLTSDPWFWFAAPPRLRAGDLLQATVSNIATFEGGPSLLPELALRIVDAAWWERFYLGRAA